MQFSVLMSTSSNYKQKNLTDKWNIIESLFDKNIKGKTSLPMFGTV